jgi:catechol 2,3-dioxygenase-like lactoylglutathione lyase family enzyme
MSIIQGLTKAILYIQDMETQVQFYRDILGLEIQHPPGLDHYHDQPWVEFATGECSLVLHVQNVKLSKDRPKLAFSVENVAIAHQLLTQRGAKLSEIRARVDGFKVADGFDPEGNPFSIYGKQ